MRQWLNGWTGPGGGAGAAGTGHAPPVAVPGGAPAPVGPTRGLDDKQSTLSRYWTMDRSLQRRLGKTNYQHIKRLCRDRGQLFEDTDFPPGNRAVYSHKRPA